MTEGTILKIENVEKSFQTHEGSQQVLRGVSLEVLFYVYWDILAAERQHFLGLYQLWKCVTLEKFM